MYKWFLNLFGWKTWAGQFADQMRQSAITYQNTFNSVGSWTAVAILLGITLLMVVLYYYVWNKLPGFHFRIWHWIGFMLISAILVGVLTFILVPVTTNPIGVFAKKAPFFPLALINLIYSVALYFLCSLGINAFFKKSTNASCTPFKL